MRQQGDLMTDTTFTTRPENLKIRPASAASFALVHVAALGVLWIGFSWQGVLLCIASYYLRMFGVTAGFHRYFSHRTFRLNRFWQFMLAFLAQTSAQKGALWWAAHHRHHHRYSDMPEDLHSPVQRGFWWSHMGWILCPEYGETRFDQIRDMAKYPELVWLDRNQYVPTMLYAVALALIFGPVGLFYGYFLSTVILWHGTFTINSVMHVFGRRVYRTTDTSRNSMVMALITMGEGWHNNHHYYPGSAAQGFRWWQIDLTMYLLILGEKLGIVKDLRRVPQRVRDAEENLVGSTEETAAAAGSRVPDRVEQLSNQWAQARTNICLRTNAALAELDRARDKAAAHVRALEKEYQAARARTSARADELLADLAAAREQLEQILVELLEAAARTTAPQRA